MKFTRKTPCLQLHFGLNYVSINEIDKDIENGGKLCIVQNAGSS